RGSCSPGTLIGSGISFFDVVDVVRIQIRGEWYGERDRRELQEVVSAGGYADRPCPRLRGAFGKRSTSGPWRPSRATRAFGAVARKVGFARAFNLEAAAATFFTRFARWFVGAFEGGRHNAFAGRAGAATPGVALFAPGTCAAGKSV